MLKIKKKSFLLRLASIIIISSTVVSWGVFGHERINHAAVLALPESNLQKFFYNHLDFLILESSIPDLRKYTLGDKNENPRHFIDLENFGSRDSIPYNYQDLKKKYDDKFLNQNGILPWYVETLMEKLTKAMKEKRKVEILFIAGDLGHYIADAHMPLHTTKNYDGQETNQKGIHSFWESRLPEEFGSSYKHLTQPVKQINDVRAEIWKIIDRSFQLKDTLLLVEQNLRAGLKQNEVYEMNDSGKVLKNKFNQPIHSKAYAKKYHDALHGMVEKQMTKAIYALACFWYTAWVNADKPDLSILDDATTSNQNMQAFTNEMKKWKQGEVYTTPYEREY